MDTRLIILEILSDIYDLLITKIYLDFSFKGKKEYIKNWMVILALVVVELLLTFNSYLHTWLPNTATVISILDCLIVMYLVACLYEATNLQRIIYVFVFQSIAVLSELAAALLIQYYVTDEIALESPLFLTSGSFLSKHLLFIFVVIFVLFSKKIKKQLPLRDSILLSIIPILSLVLTALLAFTYPEYMSNSANMLFMPMVLIAAFISIYSFKLYSFQIQNQIESEQFTQQKNQYNMQVQYTQQAVQAYNSQRKLMHDVSKHIRAIYTYALEDGNENITKYIDSIYRDFSSVKVLINSGNNILDALISDMLYKSEINSFEFIYELPNASPNTFITDYDFSILLGNLLDNAYNAVNALPVSAKPCIYLSYQELDSAISIQIKNTVQEHSTPYTLSSLLPKAKGIAQHGYGIKNCLDIARKYNGIFEIFDHEKAIEIVVVIPKPFGD